MIELERDGERLFVDPSGALFCVNRSTLVVADLHLEKGSSLARRGSLVPPYDTTATLLRLRAAIDRLDPRTVVCLGDSFHDRDAAARLHRDAKAALGALAQGREWIWVAGNHDPQPPAGLPGQSVEQLALGALVLRHEAGARGEAVEISGHFHPKARIPTRARHVTRPCFVAGRRRIVLPAFGAFAGGLEITHPLFGDLFPEGFEAFVLGQARIFRFPWPPAEARAALG